MVYSQLSVRDDDDDNDNNDADGEESDDIELTRIHDQTGIHGWNKIGMKKEKGTKLSMYDDDDDDDDEEDDDDDENNNSNDDNDVVKKETSIATNTDTNKKKTDKEVSIRKKKDKAGPSNITNMKNRRNHTGAVRRLGPPPEWHFNDGLSPIEAYKV